MPDKSVELQNVTNDNSSNGISFSSLTLIQEYVQKNGLFLQFIA